jgi:hypothetical protein
MSRNDSSMEQIQELHSTAGVPRSDPTRNKQISLKNYRRATSLEVSYGLNIMLKIKHAKTKVS